MQRRRASTVFATILALGVSIVGATPVAAAIHPATAAVRTIEVELPPYVDPVYGFGDGIVMCPDGKRAISGGAAVHREGHALSPEQLDGKLIASGPLSNGKGWYAAAGSFVVAPTTPILLRVTVVCLPLKRLDGYVVRTKDMVSPNSRVAGSLGCGEGLRMVTGGVLWNPGAGGPQANGAADLERSILSLDGRRWRAAGFAYGTQTLRIVMICLPTAAVGPLTIRHHDFTGDGDVGGGVDCPDGQRALAGGVDGIRNGVSTLLPTINASTVKLSRKGWFGAGDDNGDATQHVRVAVSCVPK